MRCLPKCLEQSRERSFGGTRTLGMAAHPVDHGKQYRLLVSCDGDPILIFLAVTDEAHIRGFDLQWRLLKRLMLRPGCPAPGLVRAGFC
jgi:hypothetical protein